MPQTAQFLSYAAGMNAAAIPPSALRKDELALIVNGTVRNGFLSTRPGWRWLPLAFSDANSQLQFESGMFQGMGFFMSSIGKFFVVCVDGFLYAIDPTSFVVVKLTQNAVFSKFSRHVWMQQRNRWFIVQDGESPPVVIDGYTMTQEVTATSIPTGTFMADGWHRLAVVSPDRRRIYFSDHEMDPNSTPISFTEATDYFANSRYFEGPPSLGKIMGITFTPYQDTSTGIGPLVVFFEKGVRAYNVATPRSQWTTNDISQTILPRTGSSSFFAYGDRGSEIIFRDHNGDIRSLRNAQQLESLGRAQSTDFTIRGLLADEDAFLRRFSCAETFDNRVLVTTHPQRAYLPDNRFNVIHKGIAVLETENLAADKEDVWVFWTGLNVCSMVAGPVRGEDSMLAFCSDEDGVNRIYSLSRADRDDTVNSSAGPQSKRIEMSFTTGFMDFDSPSSPKKMNSGGVRLSNMSGTVDINALWHRQGHRVDVWFKHSEKHPECVQFDGCSMFEPVKGSNSGLVLPSPPDKSDTFFKASVSMTIKGACTVEEMGFEAEEKSIAKITGIKCTALESAPPTPSCDVNVFGYSATKSPA